VHKNVLKLGEIAMSRTPLFLFSFLFGILNPAFADDSKNPTTQQLIEQLGHKQFSQREKAHKMLQSRGASAIPELKKALTHKDEEIRTRVEKLIPILEKLAALEPKRVTLSVDREPLSVILEQIQKQTGYSLETTYPDDQKRYSFQMKDIPFWDAVEEIRRKTNQSIQYRIVNAENSSKPYQTGSKMVSNHGPFRMELIRIHEDRDVDFQKVSPEEPSGKKSHSFTMTFLIVAEPKFYIHSSETPVLERAIDPDEHSFVLPKPVNDKKQTKAEMHHFVYTRFDLTNYQYVPTTELKLTREAENSKTIKEIRGILPVFVVIERKDRVVVEDVFSGKGNNFKCKELPPGVSDKSPEVEYTINIKGITQTKKGDFEIGFWIPHPLSEGKNGLHSRFYLKDSMGRRTSSNGIRCSSSGSGRSMELFFEDSMKVGEEKKTQLVLEDWVIMRYEIPFVFRDVPLP
jgi:hypothetical protein